MSLVAVRLLHLSKEAMNSANKIGLFIECNNVEYPSPVALYHPEGVQ